MSLLNLASQTIKRIFLPAPKLPEYECYICKGKPKYFVPFLNGQASIPPFCKELDIIGSDVDHFNCPLCKCHDRERHLFMFFDHLALWPKAGARVLHIAPERKVSERFLKINLSTYVRGDLFPSKPEITAVDITSINFPNHYFDLVLCNHVLEHVPDDLKALTEIYRVLKPGGQAVLQTPYSGVLATSLQDANINTDEMRLRYYGQEDHVRVYGMDLFSRIRDAGFLLEIRQHNDVLTDIDPIRFGVNRREPLILATRPST